MKLADSIFRYGVDQHRGAPVDGDFSRFTAAQMRLINAAVCIEATNVADYIDETLIGKSVMEIWDVPSVMPPFDWTWFEWRVRDEFQTRAGVMLSGWDAHPDDERRHVDGWMYLSRADRKRPVYVGNFRFDVDRKTGAYIDGSTSCPDDDAAEAAAYSATAVIATAIGFMHCKNVKREPVELPAKQARAFERRHKRAPFRFHTLQIDPMKEVLETEGGVSHNGLKKALHICRGHFATYTPEKPLFGKVTGTFWKPAHVRGSAKAGIVGKAYAVNAPRGGRS